VLGNLRIMFPMVSTLHELRQAKTVLSDLMEDLEESGQPYNRDILVGMMVEVPAAVMMLDHFVPEVDFISIGTNDLIQYTLAVDRSNKEVAPLYNASDPSVLRLIEMSVRAAGQGSVAVNLCGQMSGNPIYTSLLLGLGLRALSVPPSALPEIKKICRSVTIPQCEEVARRAMAMDGASQIENLLKDQLRKTVPELALY
jgi:phosphotransferase system enzyme I (PtsI)